MPLGRKDKGLEPRKGSQMRLDRTGGEIFAVKKMEGLGRFLIFFFSEKAEIIY